MNVKQIKKKYYSLLELLLIHELNLDLTDNKYKETLKIGDLELSKQVKYQSALNNFFIATPLKFDFLDKSVVDSIIYEQDEKKLELLVKNTLKTVLKQYNDDIHMVYYKSFTEGRFYDDGTLVVGVLCSPYTANISDNEWQEYFDNWLIVRYNEETRIKKEALAKLGIKIEFLDYDIKDLETLDL